MLKDKLRALNAYAYIRDEEGSQVIDLSFHIKNQIKKRKITPFKSRRKEVIEVKSEIT